MRLDYLETKRLWSSYLLTFYSPDVHHYQQKDDLHCCLQLPLYLLKHHCLFFHALSRRKKKKKKSGHSTAVFVKVYQNNKITRNKGTD